MLNQLSVQKTAQLNNQLHTQHSIQGEDLLKICSLASFGEGAEEIFEKVSALKFEQFFGFACHLFVTTDSLAVREELANILPKFGSIAVLSLLKITHHFQHHPQNRSVAHLATHSLTKMALQPLAMGLADTISSAESDEILSTLVSTLIQLTYHHEEALFTLIEQQTPAARWNIVKTELLRVLAEKRYQERFIEQPQPVKVRMKTPAEYHMSEVA